MKRILLALALLAFTSTAAMAIVTPGDLNRLRGLAMTLVSATITTLTATTATITTGTVTTLASTTATLTTIVNTTLGVVTENISGVFTSTRAPAADSGTTNQSLKVALTAPVDTTGTNTHQAYDVALTVSNATAGTNTVNGYVFDNYTGDAQVNVNAIKIGTSDGLGTAYAINIGTGWDRALSLASPVVNSYAAGADSGTTNNSSSITFTYPVDTTGTNTHNLMNMALTAANATGGTNTVNGMNFANYTGDAQVNVNAINIGTSDALGTANAIKVGSGWDNGLLVDSPIKFGATNGTNFSVLRIAQDAIASGQTAKTVTVTGNTSASKCIATANEIPSNTAYIKSAAPGTDQVVVTVNTDPGASNLDITVLCFD